MRARDYVRQDETMGEAAYRFMEEQVITEDNTDWILVWVRKNVRMRWWIFVLPIDPIVQYMDGLLPERALDILRQLMADRGLL